MNDPFTPRPELWPLALYVGAALCLTAALMGLSHLLGERHAGRGRATVQPYESGPPPTGSAWRRVDIRYYLVAMCFVLFDLESIFIFTWAAAVRETGWSGYFTAAVFIGVLLASLFYLWRMGALDWAGVRKR